MSAWPVARIASCANRREVGTWLGLVGVGVLFTLLVLGDPLLPQYHTFEITSLGSRAWAALRLLLAGLPLVLLVGAVLWILNRAARQVDGMSPAVRSSASILLITLFCSAPGWASGWAPILPRPAPITPCDTAMAGQARGA